MTLPGDIVIRPLTGPEELDLFRAIPYSLDDELADDLANGHRRPGWMWVALRGGRLVAKAAWWGGRDDARPAALDVLDILDGAADPDGDRIEVGVRLLETAMSAVIPADTPPPAYIRFVPPDWREHPRSRRIVEDRMAIAARTGARLLVERLRLEWRPGTPIAAPAGRLTFRPASDDGELVDLMTLALDGTLDAHSRQDLARMPARQCAVEHFRGEFARYESPRQWWQIAMLPGGEPAGFVIPARNDYNAIIAYIAVLPAHRGHGYISEILAEGTRILAAHDVPRIRAATDLGNVPMAAAFARAGWVNFERSIDMTWE